MIRPEEIVAANETIHKRCRVRDARDTITDGRAGQLALTNDRLIHSRSAAVSTIDLEAIEAIEYERHSFPRLFAWVGAALLAVTIALTIWATVAEFVVPLAMIAGLLAIIVLVAGWLRRTARLIAHTPSKSAEFVGRDADDLFDIARAVHLAT